MSTDRSVPDGASPAADQPPGVELRTLRESQDRALHMEGIPMLIALVDERGGGGNAVPPIDATDPRHAAVLARIDHYRAALAPTRRDNDMGVIASLLTVAAYEDFGRVVTP